MTAQQTQSTALVELPKEFQEDFLVKKYKEVEQQVKPELLSVDDVEGRKRIKDLALKINKSKDALDSPMRNHLKELKALPKVLEKNARESKLRFESLRADVLKPLEDARKWQDELLVWLSNVPSDCSHPEIKSFNIENIISEIEKIDQSQIWPELQKKFKVAIEAATTTAKVTLERLQVQEKQAAELEDLRKQQAEADKRERILAEQREAEAKKLAKEAEMKLKIAEQNSEEYAKKQAEKAIENERLRMAEIAEQEKQAAIAREADKQHRAKINRAAMVEMIAGGMDEEQAKMAIIMIAKKQIPNIIIQY